jgi:hypothetical protein
MGQGFGLVNSTIQTTWKKATKITSVSEPKRSRIKRFRKPERSEGDEALIKWKTVKTEFSA